MYNRTGNRKGNHPVCAEGLIPGAYMAASQQSGGTGRVWRWVIVIPLAAVLLLGAALGPYRETAYCGRCGALRIYTCAQLPFTHVTLMYWRTVVDTPFSRALRANGLRDAHDHAWHTVQGSGNGAGIATFGSAGQRLVYARLQNPTLDRFIGLMDCYRGDDATKAWAKRVLTEPPDTDGAPRCALHVAEWLTSEQFNRVFADEELARDMLIQ